MRNSKSEVSVCVHTQHFALYMKRLYKIHSTQLISLVNIPELQYNNSVYRRLCLYCVVVQIPSLALYCANSIGWYTLSLLNFSTIFYHNQIISTSEIFLYHNIKNGVNRFFCLPLFILYTYFIQIAFTLFFFSDPTLTPSETV